MDGGVSGNLSSLVLKRGYDPEFDPYIQHSLTLEEIVIMGLDAHALQGRLISALINGQAMAPLSIYFDLFASTLHFKFGINDKNRRQREQKHPSESLVVPSPSVICWHLLLVAVLDCTLATVRCNPLLLSHSYQQ
jgi:hypothetical protein